MATIYQNAMTEAELQEAVIAVAELHGWRVFHDNDSRRNNPGFPDLVLMRPPLVLFVELKTQKGRVRLEQQEWLDDLEQCTDIASGLVRPNDLEDLTRTLTTPSKDIRHA